LYITIIVVFLIAFSTRVSLLSSKIHSGDDTPKDCWLCYDSERLVDGLSLSPRTRDSIPGHFCWTKWHWNMVFL